MSTEAESAKTLGARLKEERELRGISLEEISRVTKISPHLLHAMESDAWDKLPGGIFTRNFIRLYTSHLGLEAERWVDEFKQYSKAAEYREDEDDELEKTRSKRSKAELPKGWFYALLVVVILLLVGGYVVISYLRQNTGAPQERETPAPASEAAQQGSQESSVEAEQKALRLELMETDPEKRCWFQWWGDGTLRNNEEGTSVEAGARATLEADNKIRLHINHLESVAVWINGVRRSWDEFQLQEITNADGDVISYVVDVTLEEVN